MKKLSWLFLLAALSSPAALKAQCKYEFNKKDALTDSITFRTQKFGLAGRSKLDGVYLVKSLQATFERSENSIIDLRFKFVNKTKKAVVFMSITDHLVIRFEDGETFKLKMVKNPTAWSNGTTVAYLSYQLTPEIKAKLRSGAKVKAMLITSTSFNFDIEVFKVPLAEKFIQCWLGA